MLETTFNPGLEHVWCVDANRTPRQAFRRDCNALVFENAGAAVLSDNGGRFSLVHYLKASPQSTGCLCELDGQLKALRTRRSCHRAFVTATEGNPPQLSMGRPDINPRQL